MSPTNPQENPPSANLAAQSLEDAAAQTPELDILLGMELPLTVRFGTALMTLEQVLRLDSGSVVEFDRRLNEPVELLVNSRVVARGEAVMVEGQYGIRIVELASRRDRLDSGSAPVRAHKE